MIEAAMYIALGFCTAGLIGLAILPAFYRRAARLTEEALRAVNPSSYAEVRAAQDQARARHAVELRRVERHLDGEREKAAKHHLEASRLKTEIEELKKTHKNQLADMETKVSLLQGDQHAVDLLTTEVKTLRQKLADTEKALAESWAKTPDGIQAPKSFEERQEESDWLPATDTMTLATITGLEAEVATLKAKLGRYEPTVATEVEATRDETARTKLAELEAQLVDTESKYVSAQAEVTRLSLLIDSVNVSETDVQKQLSTQIQELTNEKAQTLADLNSKNRALERASGQIQKLQADLEETPALAELRKEFRDLAARVSDAQTITISTGSEMDEPAAAALEASKEKPQEVSSPLKTANGSKVTVSEAGPVLKADTVNGAPPAKSADIASAAEALVSRVVASSRNSPPQEAKDGAPAAGEQPAATMETPDSEPKTKSSKQKKKDVA